jgi:hypothetical protein
LAAQEPPRGEKDEHDEENRKDGRRVAASFSNRHLKASMVATFRSLTSEAQTRNG